MSKKFKVTTLKYAIPVFDETGKEISTTNELKIGRFKTKHFKLLPDDFEESGGKIKPAELIPLVAGLANISIEAAGEIDFEDIEEVAEALQSFLEKSGSEIGKS